MKKLIFILFLIISCSNEKEAGQNYEKKQETLIKQSISEFAQKYNASEDWMEKIDNANNLFTIDLEKLWLIKRPILFKGGFIDIKTADENNYQILIGENLLESWFLGNFLSNIKLQLNLVCSKELIEPYLDKIKSTWDIWGDSFVFIALIDSIQSHNEFEHEETEAYFETKSVFTGKGRCIDLKIIETGILKDVTKD